MREVPGPRGAELASGVHRARLRRPDHLGRGDRRAAAAAEIASLSASPLLSPSVTDETKSQGHPVQRVANHIRPGQSEADPRLGRSTAHNGREPGSSTRISGAPPSPSSSPGPGSGSSCAPAPGAPEHFFGRCGSAAWTPPTPCTSRGTGRRPSPRSSTRSCWRRSGPGRPTSTSAASTSPNWDDAAGSFLTEEEISAAVAAYDLMTPEQAAAASPWSRELERRERHFTAAGGVDWAFSRDAQALVLLAAMDDGEPEPAARSRLLHPVAALEIQVHGIRTG